jgi:hypothetical protein
MHVKKFSDNARPMRRCTLFMADDLPTGATDTTVACPVRSSLSLFLAEKRDLKTTEHEKAYQTFIFAPSLSISRMFPFRKL